MTDVGNAIICTIDRVSTRKQPPETLLTLAIPQEQAGKVAGFLSKIGDHVGVAFAEIPVRAVSGAEGVGASTEAARGDQRRTPGKPPNELARRLHVDGYFRAPQLWAAVEAAGIYTEKEHKKWIEQQRCIAEGRGACNGDDIVLHHVTGAELPASGRGEHPRKPPHFFGVPLCSIGHHQNWAHGRATREDKRWLLEQAVALTAQRMKEKMKEFLGLDSLADLTAEQWALWTKTIGLEWRVNA